jgi:hypothetical protein
MCCAVNKGSPTFRLVASDLQEGKEAFFTKWMAAHREMKREMRHGSRLQYTGSCHDDWQQSTINKGALTLLLQNTENGFCLFWWIE